MINKMKFELHAPWGEHWQSELIEFSRFIRYLLLVLRQNVNTDKFSRSFDKQTTIRTVQQEVYNSNAEFYVFTESLR